MSQSESVDPKYKDIVDRRHKMVIAALECGRPELVRRTLDLVTIHTLRLEAAGRGEEVVVTDLDTGMHNNISRVQTKGCGESSSSAPKKNNITPRSWRLNVSW